MGANMDFEYEIVESIGILSTNPKSGWTVELNRISWGGRSPKYDIRVWSPDHSKMGKGISLTDNELSTLKNILNGRDL